MKDFGAGVLRRETDMGKNLEAQLAGLRARELTFERFVVATREDFRRMARHLLRRWPGPEWFTEDDVAQELYVGLWRALPRFDPTRGVSLARYGVFAAMSHAKRELHKARGVSVSGSPDKRPSAHEIPFAAFPDEEDLAERLAEDPVAEALLEEREGRARAFYTVFGAAETRAEREALFALRATGDASVAGAALFRDVPTRVRLRLASEEAGARHVVRSAAGALARVARTRRFDLPDEMFGAA